MPLDGYTGDAMQLLNASPPLLPTVEMPVLLTPWTKPLLITDDMLGKWFAGWVLIYDDLREPVTPELIGQMCIVGLGEDRVAVARLMEGTTPGRYDLIAQRPPDIRDVEVVWAAPIKALIQPDPLSI
jgi:hypothetical protein